MLVLVYGDWHYRGAKALILKHILTSMKKITIYFFMKFAQFEECTFSEGFKSGSSLVFLMSYTTVL